MDIEKIKQAVRDSDTGIDFDNAEITCLSEERMQIYGKYNLVSLVGVDKNDDNVKEVVVEYDQVSGSVIVPVVSCQITFEDLTLSQCPEYCFEDDSEWRLSHLSLLALDDFRKKKFKLWEHQLNEPECEAAFRRLLQQGPIRNVFDKFIFPSSEAVAAKYKVVDEHSGKTVDVPHQVGKMRIWNPEKRAYEPLDCSLVGAPSNEEESNKYWQQKIKDLKELRGAEYIETLLGSHQ
jgi:hypothetical protein